MTNVAYTSVPVNFNCEVEFVPGSGATTLVGGAARVDAINLVTGVKFAGTATILDTTTIRCHFADDALPIGKYSIQVIATPLSATERVVSAEDWYIKPGAA